MTLLAHIGLHKTATTWMRKHLFTEANGFLLIDRLLTENMFDRAGVFDFDAARVCAQCAPALHIAEERGLTPVLSLEHFTGTPYNRGLTIPLYAERLAACFPEAKLLLTLREQQATIASWYSLYVRSGGACSVRDFILPPDIGNKAPLFRFDFLQYDRLIALYRRLFGVGSLCVLAYEEFRSKPRDFIAQVMAHVEQPMQEAVPVEAVVNAQRSPLGMAVQRRINPLLQRNEANGWSPAALPNAYKIADPLFAHIGKLIPEPVERYVAQRRSNVVSELCAGRFEESNRHAAELSGLDLAAYGYAL